MFLRDGDHEPIAEQLPSAVAEIVRRMPPPSLWMSEAHAQLIFLAQRRLFDDDDAYIAHARRSNIALLESPMYRVLFKLLTLKLTARMTGDAWKRMHVGTELGVSTEGRTAIATLSYPKHLYSPLICRCLATGLEAALVVAGAKEVHVVLDQHTERQARFIANW